VTKKPEDLVLIQVEGHPVDSRLDDLGAEPSFVMLMKV